MNEPLLDRLAALITRPVHGNECAIFDDVAGHFPCVILVPLLCRFVYHSLTASSKKPSLHRFVEETLLPPEGA